MASNIEDGAYACQCSLSMTGCFFENNGQGGSGDGLNSVCDRRLFLESCVFAQQLVTKESVGLRVEVGGSDVGERGDGSRSTRVINSSSSKVAAGGTSGNSIISGCQFIFNNVGCHIALSPNNEPPPLTKCSFLGNVKIGMDLSWFYM
jgi:hypothetical protein